MRQHYVSALASLKGAGTIALSCVVALGLALAGASDVLAKKNNKGGNECAGLPSHAQLTETLKTVVAADDSGFDLEMWATVVNRDGVVCAVTFSGEDRGDQWPGSRVISAQKANTANAFSLSGLALSTANLWAATQPGSSLFGLQFSNPVSPDVAYGGPSAASASNPAKYGQANDPLVHRFVGGVNVFGGGLALYNDQGVLVGALGLSGDSSCADHIKAWKVRDALELDNVPAGVSPTGDDNFVDDVSDNGHGIQISASGFGHPRCGNGEETAIANLPTDFPIGPNP
jgi:uncharacterized protein GlcG (DUF336 family)